MSSDRWVQPVCTSFWVMTRLPRRASALASMPVAYVLPMLVSIPEIKNTLFIFCVLYVG